MKRFVKIASAAAVLVIFLNSVTVAGEGKHRLIKDSSLKGILTEQGISVIFDQISNRRVATLIYEQGEVRASAMSFVVKFPGGFAADVTDCLADLPSDFQGGCKAYHDEVRVILFSPTNAPVPSTTLGSLIFTPASSRDGRRAGLASSESGTAFSLERVDIGEAR